VRRTADHLAERQPVTQTNIDSLVEIRQTLLLTPRRRCKRTLGRGQLKY
jgi:hypothetical protein